MSFSLISFHYPFTVYLLQSLQSLKHLHLIIIEILPVLIDSTAILKSVARVSLAINKILVIHKSFNIIARQIILTRVFPILHLVAIASYLYIILFKVDGIGFMTVDIEISVHCILLVYIYYYI